MDKKLRKIVSEELSKIIREKYNYAAEEREYADAEYYTQDVEAEISTALSFMQDMQGSLSKLNTQKELSSTNQEVDGHIDEAISHMKQAIETYLETLSPDVKSQVIGRLGEINIDK